MLTKTYNLNKFDKWLVISCKLALPKDILSLNRRGAEKTVNTTNSVALSALKSNEFAYFDFSAHRFHSLSFLSSSPQGLQFQCIDQDMYKMNLPHGVIDECMPRYKV